MSSEELLLTNIMISYLQLNKNPMLKEFLDYLYNFLPQTSEIEFLLSKTPKNKNEAICS